MNIFAQIDEYKSHIIIYLFLFKQQVDRPPHRS